MDCSLRHTLTVVLDFNSLNVSGFTYENQQFSGEVQTISESVEDKYRKGRNCKNK